jgi:hypothetical protein
VLRRSASHTAEANVSNFPAAAAGGPQERRHAATTSSMFLERSFDVQRRNNAPRARRGDNVSEVSCCCNPPPRRKTIGRAARAPGRRAAHVGRIGHEPAAARPMKGTRSMTAGFVEAVLKRQIASLGELLGDARVRYRLRRSPYRRSSSTSIWRFAMRPRLRPRPICSSSSGARRRIRARSIRTEPVHRRWRYPEP